MMVIRSLPMTCFRCFSSQANEVIKFHHLSELVQQWSKVKDSFKKYGAVQLHPPNSGLKTLKEVASLFGSSQKHARNPVTGITKIVGTLLEGQNSSSQVISNEEFFPHTDGTYLNGMTIDKMGKCLRVGPPRFILLQCMQPAVEGGINQLIDAQKILQFMIYQDKSLVPALFHPVSIFRGNYLAMDVPIFKRITEGKYSIRFSYDKDLYHARKFKDSLADFNAKYILNEDYMTSIQLKKNQILVIDNFRMLHARTSFCGQRIMRRLWIYDDASNEMIQCHQEKRTHYESLQEDLISPLEQYEEYGRLKKGKRKIEPIEAGIHLSFKTEKILKEILINHSTLSIL